MKLTLAFVLIVLGLISMYKGYSTTDDKKVNYTYFALGVVLFCIVVPLIKPL
ncbi:hypothetical protein [Weissella viridescens]|uniref:hypothetical protein n=1 Tax=Weissella viridescens TaxID=1629 RepID=UPI001747CEF2|nr:hypothetical protein [Weissella viridescens]MBX4172098.1 hypothetical protein [Weissella viridescens]MCB6839718.1 hypothetical protein [Weissella viridescens]MCB6846450.1 hypothetical protein [Weissella viridescens]QOD85715.1 hypothetical protein IE337_05800 [Weissella viridescens]WJI90829.1 hypothetical protein PWA48_05790 [Weissella viridescens]